MTTTAQPVVPSSRRPGRGQFWLIPLALLCLGAAGELLSAYVPPDVNTARVPIHSTAQYVFLLGHIFFAAVALVVGVAQFWPWLRRTHPRVHRVVGRTYLFAGVFPASLFAVPVLFTTELGLSTQFAFAAIDAGWVTSAVLGFRAVRAHRYADHRAWLIRNFAFTLSAVGFRLIELPAYLLIKAEHAHLDKTTTLHDIASTSAWLGVLINLLVAEYLVRRVRASRASGTTRTARPR